MSKSNSDVLLIGGLAVAAIFVMGRMRTAAVAGTTPQMTLGPQRIGNTGGMSNGGFTGLMTGSVLGAMLGRSGSPDLINAGASGGSTGGFFSDLSSYDNANSAVQSQTATDLMLGGGAVPVNYNWNQWQGAVGGAQSAFTMPDMSNSNQNAYSGFDNPNNYG